jgi:hypothetical protein
LHPGEQASRRAKPLSLDCVSTRSLPSSR